MLGGGVPAATVAVWDLRADGEPAARGVVYFKAAKDMHWPDPDLKVDVRRAGTGYAIDLRATRFARAVWIDAGDAELSDNALTLLPGERVTVHATSPSDLAALRTSLRVRSLADAPAFTKSR